MIETVVMAMAASATRAKRNDYTCRCDAYNFPHRFGGGKCSEYNFVQIFWAKFYGWTSACADCNSFVREEQRCEVLDGGNKPKWCEALIEFKDEHGLK